ncbi:hypothetical protein BV22DRAFT_1023046 [Leucogyrophana mollusca]|uniref:Uncharacterized protein n=1 Tax=Leucogyrophana mollusca TaxID=85980 RepID=A0ACB8B0Y1_9AGAM|nr:hypothetical protein BV22DRAFT_1023046 [Leucogyrophana mollusca]
MFRGSVQPSIISLFSSTNSNPLNLFSTQVDGGLPSDSFIHFLDDSTSLPTPASPATLISAPTLSDDANELKVGHTLLQSVLHIQSPTLRTTFIRCPPSSSSSDLGLKHKWLHLQIRNLGREWSFEVGLVDQAGRCGTVRCSTFQKEPRLIFTPSSPPILHLPLAFPLPSTRPLTAWSTITLNLASLIPHFSSHALTVSSEDDIEDQVPSASNLKAPSGQYSHVSYVKVYATCRLRRIWFSDSGPGQRVPWEFELYGD